MKKLLCALALLIPCATAQERPLAPEWREYFEGEVGKIEASFEQEVRSAADWDGKKGRYRAELKEMLGLEPEPPRSDLHPVVTGQLEAEGVVVEKLHFQAAPQLYVTGNFYRPRSATGKLPTILYVCGHGGEMSTDGRHSNGNKTHYQHHGAWFAQHGYNCLIIDTVQWGEFLGEHHGTYRLNRWWWIPRGYTPAGLETWSSVRALDYLATRPEVDMTKVGCTGRSGGGAYTWFLAAVDDRVKVACPTAGITTLRDHVLGGRIAGHCDCMFMQNFYRWDFDKLAALTAPRPLLISNTDKDNIFPLDGVMQVFRSSRRLYHLLGADANLGLQLAEGPHHDSQPLHIGAFHWFERFLKGAAPLAMLKEPAAPLFDKDALRVFDHLPANERNTDIDQYFVPEFTPPPPPETAEEWAALKTRWMRALREKVFPMGIGPERKTLASAGPEDGHLRRRFYLAGLCPDPVSELYRHLLEPGDATGEILIASQPSTHRQGPYYFNILRHLDLPQAVAMAAETRPVRILGRPEDYAWARQTADKLGFGKNLILEPEMNLLENKRIWDQAPHQAFTDLLRHGDQWLCVFREGSSHAPGTNGVARVLASKDGASWESVAVVAEPGIDLRDPKLCQLADGRLLLSMGGSVYSGSEGADALRQLVTARSRVSFSTNGRDWTAPQPAGRENEWIWRATPIPANTPGLQAADTAVAMSYRHGLADRAQGFQLSLLATANGADYRTIATPDPGRQCWPNETTVRLAPDGSLLALVRNERRRGPAFLATASPPYKQWRWQDTGRAIQGPNFIIMRSGKMLYAGREFLERKPVTTVGYLTAQGHARPMLRLPSGADCSYPGLVEAPDGTVWISHYSSHEGKTCVYLAKVQCR